MKLTWIENFFDGFFQKLFENSVLVDAGLVKPLEVHKFDPKKKPFRAVRVKELLLPDDPF